MTLDETVNTMWFNIRCHHNAHRLISDRVVSGSNISNNIKAGGTKYSETFVFNPTENLKSRRFYDRAIKLWERNSKNESEE